jgi:hypothetical protein
MVALRISLIKAASTTSQSIPNKLRPNEFDDARVVIAIRKVVIQGRETMPLARLFHLSQLAVVKLGIIDVAPVEWRSIHRETWRHSAIGPDDHIILARAAIPLGEMQILRGVLHDARHVRNLLAVPLPLPSPFQPKVFNLSVKLDRRFVVHELRECASGHPALNRKPRTLIIFQHRKHMPKFFQASRKLIAPLVGKKHGQRWLQALRLGCEVQNI